MAKFIRRYEGYANFKAAWVEHAKQIAKALSKRIAKYVRARVADQKTKLEDVLDAFFAEVSAFTGEESNSDPAKGSASTNRISSWKRGSADLAIATLYFLKESAKADDFVAFVMRELSKGEEEEKIEPSGNLSIRRTPGGGVRKSGDTFALVCQDRVNAVMDLLIQNSIERQELTTALDQFVADRIVGKNDGLALITAPAGYGKSVFAATWCRSRLNTGIQGAVHFCRFAEPATHTVSAAIRSLLHQVLGDCTDIKGDDFQDQLYFQLSLARETPLILWLDGVDEADCVFSSFIPTVLGSNVCIVISARAEPGDSPEYLTPFLDHPISSAGRLRHFTLEKFSKDEAKALVREMGIDLSKEGDVTQKFEITYLSSDEGHPILLSMLIDDIIRNKELSLNASPNSSSQGVGGYLEKCVAHLRSSKRWRKYCSLFSLLSIIREPIAIRQVDVALAEEKIKDVNTIPIEFRRWITISLGEDGDDVLAFSHPLLQDLFRHILGKQAVDAESRLIRSMSTKKIFKRYLFKHYLHHWTNLGKYEVVLNFLADDRFFEERVDLFGNEEALRLSLWDATRIWQMGGELSQSEMREAHKLLEYYLSRATPFIMNIGATS